MTSPSRPPSPVLNVLTNWGSFAVLAAVNLFLSPYIVHQLGNTVYGLWAVVGSSMGYLGLLDLGVRGAVTRYMARYAAQEEFEAANRLASSAFALFTVTSIIALVTTAGLAVALPALFDIPPNELGVARLAVICGGGVVAATLISGVFGGTLAALHRFTVLGAIDIGLEGLRVVSVLVALGEGGGLFALAMIQLSLSVVRLVTYLALSKRVLPSLRIRFALANRETIRLIVSFSGYSTLIYASSMLSFGSDSIVIGALLPLSAVTFFAIGANLTEYTRAVLSGISQPLAPLVSAADAIGAPQQVARMLGRSVRLGTLVIVPILITFAIRGPTFIGLWMGPSYSAVSGQVLRVLTLAAFFAASYQMVTVSMVGVNRHRKIVPIFVGEALVNLCLSLLLARPFGVVGVAIGTMLPRVVVAVWYSPLLADREFGIPRLLYIRNAWLRPALAAAPFALVSYLEERTWTAGSVMGFFLQVAAALPAAAIGAWLFGLDAEERLSIRRWVAGRLVPRRRDRRIHSEMPLPLPPERPPEVAAAPLARAAASVVVITTHYPPDKAVGALRPAKVARAAANANGQVHVITSPVGNERTPRGEPGLTVHEIKSLPHVREMYAGFRRWWAGQATGQKGTLALPSAEETAEWVPPNPSLWKRFIYALMWLPDDRTGFIFPAVRRVLDLRLRRPWILYSSGPPFSPHLTALLLRWLTRAPWIMEYRDPWTGNDKQSWIRTGFTDAIDRWLERRCLGAASLIVTVSDGISDRLRPLLRRGQQDKLFMIRNGIDEISTAVGPSSEPRNRLIRLAHLGTFYFNRDPRPFLRAVARLRAEPDGFGGPLEIHLIGNARRFETLSVEDEVRRFGLQDVIHFTDWVPHAEGWRAMQEANILLLFAQHQPGQVPNKLYEYLGARRPVLAYLDLDGESARMLRAAGSHYLVDSDAADDGIAELRRAIGEVRDGVAVRPNLAQLEQWSTARQMELLMSRLAGLLR